jgi:hypothetical protein
MSLSEFQIERVEHPIDKVEHVAVTNDWSFERTGADEISIVVAGHWADYHVAFTWMDNMEAMHIAAAFDLKVPERRKCELQQLVCQINEQMWVGHFDHWPKDNVVMFRHSIVLSEGAEATSAQYEAMLGHATTSCERYYQAFQFVVWAGKTANDALSSAMFETIGEA